MTGSGGAGASECLQKACLQAEGAQRQEAAGVPLMWPRDSGEPETFPPEQRLVSNRTGGGKRDVWVFGGIRGALRNGCTCPGFLGLSLFLTWTQQVGPHPPPAMGVTVDPHGNVPQCFGTKSLGIFEN